MAGEKILFVDDEEQIRKLLTAYLTRRGYAVATAVDAVTAMAAVEAERPRLVITDINMPGIDGVELARRLRADQANAGLAIIVLSAEKATPEVLVACAETRAHFLPKPIVMSELGAKVAALVGEPSA